MINGVLVGDKVTVSRFTKANKPRRQHTGTVVFKNQRMITVKFLNGSEAFTLADIADKTIEIKKGAADS